jgi:endoglucanase
VPALTMSGYRREISSYVAALNRRGIYAILDLHWSAPGSQVALEQQPMPDRDHAPAFWKSVATTFKSDRGVVFDLYNEPYDPTDPRSGDDQSAGDKVTWNCWATGTRSGAAGGSACFTAAYDENGAKTTRYQVAGMQSLVNAVRNAGAKQPVLLGGLDFANDLGDNNHGQSWLTHAPHDPRNQEAASFHNYMGKSCATKTCWGNAIAAVAKHVPVVTGEFDEDNYLERRCGTKTPSTFDERYMDWADAHGISYLAWGWITETQAERDADGCGAFYLLGNYTAYTPAKPNGTAVHTHLRALKAPK